MDSLVKTGVYSDKNKTDLINLLFMSLQMSTHYLSTHSSGRFIIITNELIFLSWYSISLRKVL